MSPRRSYLLKVGEPYVMVPARVAALVDREISALRVRVRGVDPEATAVLEDLHEAALTWRGCVTATLVDRTAQPDQDLNMITDMVTSTQVADQLGLSGAAIRKAITGGRLPAEKVGRQWVITRENFEHFKAARAA